MDGGIFQGPQGGLAGLLPHTFQRKFSLFSSYIATLLFGASLEDYISLSVFFTLYLSHVRFRYA